MEIEHIDGHLAIAFVGRVQILSWRQLTTASLMRTDASVVRAFSRHHRAKLCTLAVVATNTAIPDAESRETATRLTKKMAETHIASATVFEGEGFWAGAARAFLSGVLLLSRTRIPHKPFGRIDDAAAWIGGHLSLSPADVRVLIGAAEGLRQRHLAHPAG